MSQLNLRKIQEGDTLGSLIEKANYNFEQIILNGGGPQGSTGLPSRPGMPGRVGPTGSTGLTGASGTHIYTGETAPNSIASFSPGSREGDVYLRSTANTLEIWFNSTTGATGGWVLSDTINSPDGFFLTALDDSTTPDKLAIFNDPGDAEKLLIADKTSLSSLDYIFSLTGASAAFIPQFQEAASGIQWLSMFGATKNQIRLLNTESSLMAGLTTSDRNVSAGGAVLSLELKPGATVSQVFKIVNLDSGTNKDFLLNLNSTLDPAIYVDSSSRLQVGGAAYATLYDKMRVVGSVVIGSTSGATASVNTTSNYSLVVEGRISAGTYKIDTQSRFFGYGSTFSSARLDSNFGIGSISELHLSQGYVQGSSTKPEWRLSLGVMGTTGATTDKAFRIRGSEDGVYANSRPSVYIGVTGVSGWTRMGIENEDPIATLEVGPSAEGRFTVGQIAYGTEKSSAYWGFNIARERGGSAASWIRRKGQDSSSALMWMGNQGAVGLAVLLDTGGTVSYSDDSSLLDKTQFYFVSATGGRGKLAINSRYSVGSNSTYAPSLVIGATTSSLYNFGTQSYGVGLYGTDAVIEMMHATDDIGLSSLQAYSTRLRAETGTTSDGSGVSFFVMEHRGPSADAWKTSLMARVSAATGPSSIIGYVGIGTTGNYREWISGATVSKYGPREMFHVDGNIRTEGNIILNSAVNSTGNRIKAKDSSRVLGFNGLTGSPLYILGAGSTAPSTLGSVGRGGNIFIDSGVGSPWYYLSLDSPGNTSIAYSERGDIYLLWDGETVHYPDSGRVAVGLTYSPLARMDIRGPGATSTLTVNRGFDGPGASFHALIVREGASGATSFSINKYGRVDSGIAFSTVATNRSDSRTLDDYEEGIFATSFYYGVGTRGNTGSAVVNSGSTGYYTKVGDLVTFTISTTIGSLTVGETAGILELGNLPYYSAYDTSLQVYAEDFQKPAGESSVVLQAKVFAKPTIIAGGVGPHKGKRIAIGAYNPSDGSTLTASSTAELLLENSTFIVSGSYKASW
jgi:hypothetical protein